MVYDHDVVELSPNNAVVYSNRGNSKIDLKDCNGAIKDCAIAIQLDSNCDYAYVNLAVGKKNLDSKNYAELH